MIYLFLAICVAILFCFFAASYYIFKREFITNNIDNQRKILFAAVMAAILNTIIALSLVYSFSSKLFQLALLRRQSIVEQGASIDIEFTETQKKFIRIVTKQVLLNVIGIISFNILIPLVVTIYFFIPYKNIYTYLGMILLGFIFHTIEMLSVILSFGFNGGCYRFCCGKCHKGCNKFCEKIAEKKVKRRMMSQGPANGHGDMSRYHRL